MVFAYLCNFLPSTAEIDKSYVHEVSPVAYGDGFLFEGPLRADEDHIPNLLILEAKSLFVFMRVRPRCDYS